GRPAAADEPVGLGLALEFIMHDRELAAFAMRLDFVSDTRWRIISNRFIPLRGKGYYEPGKGIRFENLALDDGRPVGSQAIVWRARLTPCADRTPGEIKLRLLRIDERVP